MSDFRIMKATEEDVPLIVKFIRRLAEYERLTSEAVVTEQLLRESLFGKRPVAEVVLGYHKDEPVAFAVFFQNFSTFLGRSGLYLEDLFVIPEMRFYRNLGAVAMSDWTVFRLTGEALERLAGESPK
ncbi:MAG: GNAT family N-acetyltransferase [Acidobacteria bacterium]|nr:MAG: GNAT family N-acetyltransferase [Acidobacteriota bacterium]